MEKIVLNLFNIRRKKITKLIMKKKYKINNLEKKIEWELQEIWKKIYKKKKIQKKKNFVSITNVIIFICGYCVLRLNLQLLLIISIINNTYILPI